MSVSLFVSLFWGALCQFIWFSAPSLKAVFLNIYRYIINAIVYYILILILLNLELVFVFRYQWMRCCSTSLFSFLREQFWIIPLFLSRGLRSLLGQQDLHRWVTLKVCVIFLLWHLRYLPRKEKQTLSHEPVTRSQQLCNSLNNSSSDIRFICSAES